jgi:hypothetical protein
MQSPFSRSSNLRFLPSSCWFLVCSLFDPELIVDIYQITSKLVWECHKNLTQLARYSYNRVQLIWVPEHEDIVGNEMADQLARTGSEHPFIGPQSACGILVGVAKKVGRDWSNRNHKEYWDSVTGLTQAMGFILGVSVR